TKRERAISAAAFWPASLSISNIVTAAPARSNIAAIALPIPCAAPVTIAVLPSSVIILSSPMAVRRFLSPHERSSCAPDCTRTDTLHETLYSSAGSAESPNDPTRIAPPYPTHRCGEYHRSHSTTHTGTPMHPEPGH